MAVAEQLTPQQYEAVDNRGGKLLVSAAAGSGKTKVLVDRLVSYILDPVSPANIDDFLIITYTKAAAAELRGKISKKLSELIAQQPDNRHLRSQMQRLYLAKISTVHSFCSEILREYAYQLDIAADFRVLDEKENAQLQVNALEMVIEQAYVELDTQPEIRTFFDTQGLGRNDRQIPEIILRVYNSSVCHLNPKQWLQRCLETMNVTDIDDPAQTVWGAYLIDEFKAALEKHIASLKNCLDRVALEEGFEKPAALLEQTVNQLRYLAGCGSWNEIWSVQKIDFGRLTFSKKCTDLQLVEQIKAIRDACKRDVEKRMRVFSNSGDQILDDLRRTGEAAEGLVLLVDAFGKQYEKLKSSHRVLDFIDLEQKTLDLLLGIKRSGPTSVARQIGNRFREVMVDEYQDSNVVQDTIFSALTCERNNCFMVGDVKQAIYQFRLADPGIFIEKYNRYGDAADAQQGEGRKVLLSSNFRSSEGIINGVNFVFSRCMSEKVGGLLYGEAEMLREGIPHTSLGEPEVELYGIDVDCDTYAEEAAFTAQRIRQLLDGSHFVRDGDALRPIRPEDIVILLRSPKSVGGEFRYALEQMGIPCTAGDNSELLQMPEITALRSILQIIDNPRQDIPLLAALTSPVFAFSADELASIRGRNRNICFYDALVKAKTNKTEWFLEILSQLRNDAKMDSLCELLSHIFQRTKLMLIYSAMEAGDACQENLNAFFKLSSDFENGGRRDLAYFLKYLEMLESKGGIATAGSGDGDCVRIMSIHKSKGLEFPVVFLCGLSRRFNEENAKSQVLCHKDLGMGLGCADTKNRVRYPSVAKKAIQTRMHEEGISEELRILYVAMTRARDRLIMTYAVKNLGEELQDIAMRMELSHRDLLTSSVSCPGEWILLSALSRTEAGAFFALGGNPGNSAVDMPAWKIAVVDGMLPEVPQLPISAVTESQSDSVLERIRAGLAFTYPNQAATAIPSKQTATQLKGREKDQEISQGSLIAKPKSFRNAVLNHPFQSGTTYGTAMHALMQYIRYDGCTDEMSVQAEIARLVDKNLLTPEQGRMVRRDHICRLFQTPIGKKLQTQKNIIREFKFSVLMDAGKYYDGVAGEQILLQGVVDCALVEDDGITLIDFKTDYVTPQTLSEKVTLYEPQVNAYADALEEIFEKKVRQVYLYFFHTGEFVSIQR